MHRYDITKYKSRTSMCSNLTTHEWTSICDIGSSFNGMLLTTDGYIAVEDAYVNAVLQILNYMRVDILSTKDVHRWGNITSRIESTVYKRLYTDSMLNTYHIIHDNMMIDKTVLSDLIRLQLREDIGVSVYVPYRFKLFIGYDYLMGVHSSVRLEPLFPEIKKLGLNIFSF